MWEAPQAPGAPLETETPTRLSLVGRIVGGLLFVDFFAVILALMLPPLGAVFAAAGSVLVPWFHLKDWAKRPWVGVIVTVAVHGAVLFASFFALALYMLATMEGF